MTAAAVSCDPSGRSAAHRACVPRNTRYAAPPSLSATKAGSAATRRATMPALVATDHVACPSATPAAVANPDARPPRSVLRIVSAVSGPGVTITMIESTRNPAKSDDTRASLTLLPFGPTGIAEQSQRYASRLDPSRSISAGGLRKDRGLPQRQPSLRLP